MPKATNTSPKADAQQELVGDRYGNGMITAGAYFDAKHGIAQEEAFASAIRMHHRPIPGFPLSQNTICELVSAGYGLFHAAHAGRRTVETLKPDDANGEDLRDHNFPVGYWLPRKLAKQWKTPFIPLEPTKQSIQEWRELLLCDLRRNLTKDANNRLGTTYRVGDLIDEVEHDELLLKQAMEELGFAAPAVISPAMSAGDTKGNVVTVYHHGERSYSLADQTPIIVSAEQHGILSAFATAEAALDTKVLGKHVANVSRVVKQLENKLPGAVRRPTVKGEGYYMRVEPAPKN